MSNNNEITQDINSITSETNSFFENFATRIEKRIINQKEKTELIDDLISKTRQVLTKIFGEEGKLEDKKLSKNFMEYLESGYLYSDAVIFNYWSYEGESIKSSISKTQQYKRNIFYKGARWSNKNKSKAFYDFFNDIKEALEGDAPVDFFTENAINNSIEFLKITGKNGIEADGGSGFLQMPILFDENTGQVATQIKSDKFKVLIKFIYELRKNNKDPDEVSYFKNNQSRKLKDFKNDVSEALEQMKTTDKDILEQWTRSFTLALKNDGLTITSKDVFNVVVAYQYYDHPYSIYMFLPSFEAGNKKQLYSCLIITLNEDSNAIESYKTALGSLSKALKKVPESEKAIWEKHGQNLPNYWRWKHEYANYYDSYYRLSNVALNICLSICKRKDIDYFDIPKRVKNFDSFYNKIVNRANGRDEDFPRYRDFLTESDFISKHPEIKDIDEAEQDDIKKNRQYQFWRDEFCKIYRDKILNPDKENREYILHNLKDIAGLRIVCLFRNDFVKFLEEINKIKDSEQLEIIDPGSHSGEWGYRSYHLVIKLGEERKRIYELQDLSEEKCEIQIRTILDQGCDDVSHKLFYKPNVTQRIINEIRNTFGEKMKIQSTKLGEVDEVFDEIREKVKSIIKDSKLHVE